MKGGKVRKRDLEAILLPWGDRGRRKQPFLSSTRRDSGTLPPHNLQCVCAARPGRMRGYKQIGLG